MSAYKKWLARIEDKKTAWTEQEIIFFRRAIGQCGLKDPAERALLRSLFADAVENEGYKITREQDMKGLRYLLDKSLKKNGEHRKGSKFGTFELAVLLHFSHHTLSGLYRDTYCEHYLPIYRAYDTEGNWFEYVGTTYEQIQITSISGYRHLRVV